MKIYFINLEQATERRDAIERAFAKEDLVRVDALDGMIWASGAEGALPAWGQASREQFVEQGILAEHSMIPPTHMACNLSHKMAWELFLATDDEWCVVLEDDVEPTETLGKSKIEDVLEIPKGCGMFYLMDERSIPGRLRLRKNGQVERAMTLAAYALNRRTAEIFVNAVTPIVHLADAQLPIATFEGMQKWVGRQKLGRFESEKKVKACGMHTGGLIRHSLYANESQLGNPIPS